MKAPETTAALVQDVKPKSASRISFWQLLFLTTAFFASIRRIPNLAYAGWETVLFMVFAIVMFVLPVSFVSAELATAMPSDGGLSVWISRAVSPRWGFVASFLVWIQMCFGMVTVGAAFSDMLSTIMGNKSLLTNNLFIGLTVIIIFWLITLLIIAGVPLTAISTWGMILGLMVPLAILLVMGTAYMVLKDHTAIKGLDTQMLTQDFTGIGGLAKLSGIIFLFAGMEQASNYANRIENPRKNYPRALILATLIVAVLFTFAGLLVYFIIPGGSLQLADPAQVFTLIFKAFGVPWLSVALAVLIALSCITELSAWISGPSRNLLHSARSGVLPGVFAKTNRHDVPVPLVLLQAGLVTAIALVFVFIPGTNSVFDAILTMAVAIYVIVYMLILVAGIRYRKKHKAQSSAFQIPGGRAGAAIFTVLGFVGMAVVFASSLIPPAKLDASLKGPYPFIILLGVAAFTLLPLLIFQLRRNKIKPEAEEDSPATQAAVPPKAGQ